MIKSKNLHLSTETNLKLTNTNLTYGSVLNKNCKSFFMDFNFWTTITKEDLPILSVERNRFLYHYKHKVENRIKKLITNFCTGYKWSFTNLELSESFNKKNIGFGTLSIQVFLDKLILEFRRDMVLRCDIERVAKLIDMELLDSGITISRNKSHANPNKKSKTLLIEGNLNEVS